MTSLNPLAFNAVDPKAGDILFKMTVRIHARVHDGYCSCFDFDEESEMDSHPGVSTEDKDVIIYFKIPKQFENKIDEIVDNGELIKNDATKILFKEWTYPSDCGIGSGCCNLLDRYTPVRIDYVEII